MKVAKVQFGFTLPGDSTDKRGRGTLVADLSRALELISGHFDGAWMIDHLQFGAKDVLEGFTTLTYMAALHPQLRFGHTVLCQSFRNPALLAKMAATLQLLSGGRFVLGLGAGWNEAEYTAYGYDFPTNGVRVEQLEEAVQIIRGMWTQPQASFGGQHYRIHEAYCEPKPDTLPPLMIGAFGPKMLRLTARYADWWNVSSVSAVQYRELAAEFARACAEVGRDPATVRRSWCGGCACAPTQAEAESFAAGWQSDDDPTKFDFCGTPEQIVAQMRPFIEQGVDYFMLDCGGFPNLATLELLVSEVLPRVNGDLANGFVLVSTGKWML